MLETSQKLLTKGFHPAAISDSLLHFSAKAVEVLESMAIPVDLSDHASLLKSANTSLNSKVWSWVVFKEWHPLLQRFALIWLFCSGSRWILSLFLDEHVATRPFLKMLPLWIGIYVVASHLWCNSIYWICIFFVRFLRLLWKRSVLWLLYCSWKFSKIFHTSKFQVVHEHSGMLAPMAVDAVLKIVDPSKDTNVDLKDIRILKKLGETVEDSQLVDGIVFTQKAQGQGGPNKVEKAKIGLIQFCISPPKTDVSRLHSRWGYRHFYSWCSFHHGFLFLKWPLISFFIYCVLDIGLIPLIHTLSFSSIHSFVNLS